MISNVSTMKSGSPRTECEEFGHAAGKDLLETYRHLCGIYVYDRQIVPSTYKPGALRRGE